LTEKVKFDTIYLHMSNLAITDIDKIDELPLRDKVRPLDGHRHYWGSDYPYNKVRRFITSRVGQYWNDVFSEFCHLDWVPRQYKTKEQIGRIVELNTFLKDEKVWYYGGGFMGVNEHSIDTAGYYSRHEFFYVHPKTGILCHKQNKGHLSYKQQEEERKAKYMKILGDYHQLLKLDGVWYEVKAEPINTDVVEVNGLHYRYVKESTIAQRKFTMGVGTQVVATDKDDTYVRVNGRLAVPYTEARWEGKRVGPKDCLVESAPESGGRNYWNRPNYRSIKITVYRQLNSKQLKKYGVANDVKTEGKPCKVCGNYHCKLTHA